jgi:hypothetical protein
MTAELFRYAFKYQGDLSSGNGHPDIAIGPTEAGRVLISSFLIVTRFE